MPSTYNEFVGLSPTYHHSLTTTHLSPPTYHHPLITTHLPPPIYHHPLTTTHLPSPTYHHPLTTTHLPPPTYHRLLTIAYLSLPTPTFSTPPFYPSKSSARRLFRRGLHFLDFLFTNELVWSYLTFWPIECSDNFFPRIRKWNKLIRIP